VNPGANALSRALKGKMNKIERAAR
jgi:hypothetical protein